MLSPSSSSYISNSPLLDFHDLELEVSDAGTLFSDILDTVSPEPSVSHMSVSSMDVSDSSECDDDIVEFLTKKKLLAKIPQTQSSKGRNSIELRNKRRESPNDNDTECVPVKRAKSNNDLEQAESKKCMNKAAVSARMQRIRKKAYVNELEDKCKTLEVDNNSLQSQLAIKSNQVDNMAREIQYLKSVIANQTSLSTLLNHIPFVKNMQFGSSLSPLVENRNICNKESGNDLKSTDCKSEIDVEKTVTINKCVKGVYAVKNDSSPKLQKSLLSKDLKTTNSMIPQTTAGVCLHVSNNNVSLEFCVTCAGSAAAAISAKTEGTESDCENSNMKADYTV